MLHLANLVLAMSWCRVSCCVLIAMLTRCLPCSLTPAARRPAVQHLRLKGKPQKVHTVRCGRGLRQLYRPTPMDRMAGCSHPFFFFFFHTLPLGHHTHTRSPQLRSCAATAAVSQMVLCCFTGDDDICIAVVISIVLALSCLLTLVVCRG